MRKKRTIGKFILPALLAALFTCFICAVLIACKSKGKQQEPGLSAGDTCDGPDVNIECNFVDFPSSAASIMKIAPDSEPGRKIVIKGTLLKKNNGGPLANAMIYAYQTDSTGHYSKDGTETGPRKWQGRLYGRCITDSDGKYEIHTIRPGRYPEGSFPAHIHWMVKLPDGTATYLNDFVFSDDEMVNSRYLNSLTLPGDNGVIELKVENGFYVAYRVTEL